MFKYSVNLLWSDEDESYVATIPEFPNLSAFGDTPSEAAEEATKAAEGFIEIYNKDNIKLPAPLLLTPFSGQLHIRIPKSLHEILTQEAKKEGVSLNSYITYLLSERNAFIKTQKEIEEFSAAPGIHPTTLLPGSG